MESRYQNHSLNSLGGPAFGIGGGKICAALAQRALTGSPPPRGKSRARNKLLLAGYNFYFRHIMPRTATWIARDKSGAYKYLPQSVNTFIGREQMREMFDGCGFTDFTQKVLTCGIALVYRGIKQ